MTLGVCARIEIAGRENAMHDSNVCVSKTSCAWVADGMGYNPGTRIPQAQAMQLGCCCNNNWMHAGGEGEKMVGN